MEVEIIDNFHTPKVEHILQKEADNLLSMLNLKIYADEVIYTQFIIFFQKLIAINDESFTKYGSPLYYTLINYIEGSHGAPNQLVVIAAMEFIYSCSLYLINPFWFIGMVRPISMSDRGRIVFNHPKFINTLKTIFDINRNTVIIEDAIITIYMRYLYYKISLCNTNVAFAEYSYFLDPFFNRIDNRKHYCSELFDLLLKVFYSFKLNFGKLIIDVFCERLVNLKDKIPSYQYDYIVKRIL